jgi:DNA-binding CsgD family transcriptional regulator/PAS domain-containing protein
MRAVAEGTTYTDEYRLRRADGTYVPVRDRGAILKGLEGRPTHMVGAFNDVSGEREAEAALRERAELYETLFKNAVNPVYQLSADGRFLDANEPGLALLGTGDRTPLRRTVAELWGEAAAEAVAEVTRDAGRSAFITVELAAGDVEKQLDVTLLPCTFRGERTCFALCTDVSAHRSLRKALERSEETLRRQKASLEDANAALRVLLDQRNRDRDDLERTIGDNLQSLVLPLLERLRAHLADPEEICLDAAIGNLRELTRPFVPSTRQAEEGLQLLTPREREIANLIRMGRTSSEIAEALYISPTTVAHHRKNLRRKLGLPPRGPRLASALAVMSTPQSFPITRAATVGDRLGSEEAPAATQVAAGHTP